MKRIILFGIIAFSVLSAFSQSKGIKVTGCVIEKESNDPVFQANIQMLNLPDSVYITGAASDEKGMFALPEVTSGKYLLKVSFVGFKNKFISLQLSDSLSKKDMGKVELEPDAILMKETVITGQVPEVQVVEDTLIFNAAAYRTPDGAMLEELVKKFPGTEVDENGNIKINGKQVKKIMLNGKEFFGGDVKTGMKNLPVEMIEKVKTYDKKSDLARITGIDDGEDETVLDLTVKKGMNKGIFGNIDLSAGTEDRYHTQGMLNYFQESTQVSIIGGANNVNDRGMSGGGGGARFGGGGGGLNSSKTLGANFATETKKLELGGSFRYNYNDRDGVSKGYSENFLLNNSSFNHSNSINGSRSESFNAEFRMEWRPNDQTNFIFRPNFSLTKSRGNSKSQSATFNDDPFNDVENPNDYLDLDSLLNESFDDPLKDIRLNVSNSGSFNENENFSAGASLQLNRKLNDEGRNVTLLGRINYSDSESDSYSESFTQYYKENRLDPIFRYNATPGKNYSYSGKLTYSEPIAYATFLQFAYQLQYSYRESDRRTYNLLEATNGNEWRLYQPLPEDYMEHEDKKQSKYAEYQTLDHDMTLSLRFIRDKYQLNAGISLLPQQTELSYRKNQVDTIIKRKVFNFSPNINFRYRFSRMSNLQLSYRGRTSQPNIEELLPVEDNSNPLNIRVGNEGLKPSFSHNVNFNFSNYQTETQRNIMANASFSVIQNSITSINTYNEKTGGWIYKSDNINGNWRANAGLGYNTPLLNKKIRIEVNSNFSYANNVNYLTVGKETKKNKTIDMNLSERLRASYRNEWLEISVNGNLSYSWEKNRLRPENEQNPYNYSYGANLQIYAPWNMTLTTNIANQARRGYTDASMNRDELIWNAQLSQRISRSASLTFEMYDILKQQSNITRRLTANGRSVYEYNGVTHYCMVHFIYRLNIFGNKDARRNMRGRGGYRGEQDFRMDGPRNRGGGPGSRGMGGRPQGRW